MIILPELTGVKDWHLAQVGPADGLGRSLLLQLAEESANCHRPDGVTMLVGEDLPEVGEELARELELILPPPEAKGEGRLLSAYR